MLAKLLKYELPAMGRRLLPLYAAWAVTALVMGIGTQASVSKSSFLAVITVLLYAGVAIAILVMTVVMIIQRYSRSMLGDEAYFDLTLPVSMAAHIGNKLISAAVWVTVTAIVAVLTGLLMLIGMGFVTGFESFSPGYIDIPGDFWLYFFEFLILMIAGIVKMVMQIYAAITIGHQAQNHTTLASIGAYIAVMIFEAVMGRIFVAVIPALKSLAYGSSFLDITRIFPSTLLITVFFSAVYFFVCKYLMEKRLNLA